MATFAVPGTPGVPSDATHQTLVLPYNDREAGAAETPEEANKLYQEAEGIVAEEFTTIPTWYGKTIIGWSERVGDVQATPFGVPDLAAMTVKE